MNTIETLQKATQLLAGVCDGARDHDKQGFNGLDTHFGKSLAAQEKWSPKQAVAAQKMLTKYRKQLSLMGLDISSLPTLNLTDMMNERKAANPRPDLPHEVRLSENRNFVEFHFPYDFSEKEYVKNTLHARFVNFNNQKFWSIPFANADWDAIRKYAEQFGASIVPALQEYCLVHQTKAVELQELSVAQDADISDINLTGFEVDLYPFQRAGLKFGLDRRKVIIGDDMGLGKTLQGLAIVVGSQNQYNFIVVCPAAVKLNWQREITRAIPSITTAVWTTKSQPDANCIIINYDILEKLLPKLKEQYAGAVIFDELHYLKSSKAKRTDAATSLAQGCDYVIGLTGTPIMNRPVELIAPLRMLNQFDQFGGWVPFVRRYCKGFQRMITVRTKNGQRRAQKIWDTSGADNLQELNARLRSSCMIRRRKVDVLTDLPQKVRVQQVFEIDNRKEYESAKSNLLDYLKACAALDAAFLETLKDMTAAEREQAILEHQAEQAESAERAEQLVMIETLKQLAVSGKMDTVIEWVENFLESGEKLVLFAVHVDAQERLLKHFTNAARIVSKDSTAARQAQIQKFRTDDNCRLMIASLGAGGTGIDGLQDVCSNVAFLELGWTPALMMQAEDRLHRIGQEGQVTAWYLLAENTIEEEIQSLLAKKQAVCDSTLDGAPEVASGSVFNELLTSLSGAPDKTRRTRKGVRR